MNEASSSYNVFNERLEDAYFDESMTFHDPSNVHTFYQPYPHEKKWTKDHPLHKIIGDQKSSVRTRGQLANSCLFACLLSSIEPANVAEALKDADWVSAMQDELDQFSRLKVWNTYFSIDVIDEILEEDFDALLDEGSEILHFIEGTILEEKIFAEFDELMGMTADENSESESDTDEPPWVGKYVSISKTEMKHTAKDHFHFAVYGSNV
ncbi:hypothetical protein Tco_0745294 [Tanacetum coccineum]